jgi:uncharacterized membrane protein
MLRVRVELLRSTEVTLNGMASCLFSVWSIHMIHDMASVCIFLGVVVRCFYCYLIHIVLRMEFDPGMGLRSFIPSCFPRDQTLVPCRM